jgi:alkanesulfonate monooxygenase
MHTTGTDTPLEVFSTCPPSNRADLTTYLREVEDVARWSDDAGCKGILVYSDNSQIDAWLIAEIILRRTRGLCPLVAVQPIYMHPYAVAKTVASIGTLYHRRVYLNLVAGGFKNDLTALNDVTPHDRRYDRLTEYALIIRNLLQSPGPVTFEGEFYTVDKLKLTPRLPFALYPGVFISGSSAAGVAAARALGATAIKYPKPPDEEEDQRSNDALEFGIRVGIIARESAQEAWNVAYSRFPADRKGQLTRQLATKISDSVWHQQLSQRDEAAERSSYWLVPFQNYQTMCPYIVGSYEQVAGQMARYFSAGYRRVILDVPLGPEDLTHTFAAFDLAMQPVQ